MIKVRLSVIEERKTFSNYPDIIPKTIIIVCIYIGVFFEITVTTPTTTAANNNICHQLERFSELGETMQVVVLRDDNFSTHC